MRPKKTILCIDDNEQALSVRKFLLDTRGYRVLTALTGAEALELITVGGIDLVVCDLIMPQMDGNELVRRIKEIAPDVPTLLISGTVKAFERASNADAFMPKGSCSPLELLERIRLMIARKRGPKKHTAPRPPVTDYAAANRAMVQAIDGAMDQAIDGAMGRVLDRQDDPRRAIDDARHHAVAVAS